MSEDELVDIYDDELTKIGVVPRYEAHKKGSWHFNFHCWIVTRRGGGSVLFQVRSRSKASFPGLLDSTVGGHYRTGEHPVDLVREIEEEIGIKLGRRRLVPLGRRLDVASFGGVSKREIAEVFFVLSERPLRRYRLERSEVCGLVEVRIEEGLGLFKGRRKTATVKGLQWDDDSEGWKDSEMHVDGQSFVPKMDSYYATLFIMAERMLAGEKDLSI